MNFLKCSIAGEVYGKPAEGEEYTGFVCDRMAAALARHDPRVCAFFKLLSLCHTVRPETVNGKVEYQAESPDEKALTEAARETGFVFLDTTPEHIIIEAQGQRETYEKLALLAFNSDRKRMTVVLRAPDGTVLVLTKGADTIMFPLLDEASQGAELATLQDHLDNSFAKDGLRTLVLAQRTMSEAEYSDWAERYRQAATATPEEKEARVAAVAADLETGLTLVGASASEDKLQIGVPDAIASIREASIKLWVLTGDKRETAINIGASCRLLTTEMVRGSMGMGSGMWLSRPARHTPRPPAHRSS